MNIMKWYLGIGAAHLIARLAGLAILKEDDPLVEIYNKIDGELVGFRKAVFCVGGAIGLLSNVVVWPVYDVRGIIDGINLLKKEKSAE